MEWFRQTWENDPDLISSVFIPIFLAALGVLGIGVKAWLSSRKNREPGNVTAPQSHRSFLDFFRRRTAHFVGIDVGRAYMEYCLLADRRSIVTDAIKQERVSRREHGGTRDSDALLQSVVELVVEAATQTGRLKGVGIGVPAPVDPVNGQIDPSAAFNPGAGREFRSRLQALLAAEPSLPRNLPIRLDNDATCAARFLKHYFDERDKDARNVVTLSIGNGLGGGLIIDRKVIYGSSYLCGEFGHATISSDYADAYDCLCGRRGGHFEKYVSTYGFVQIGRQLDLDAFTLLAKHNGIAHDADFTALKNRHSMATLMLRALSNPNSPSHAFALAAANSVCTYLGIGIAGLITSLNPDRMVLTGGLVDHFFGCADQQIAKSLRNVVAQATEDHAISSALSATSLIYACDYPDLGTTAVTAAGAGLLFGDEAYNALISAAGSAR